MKAMVRNSIVLHIKMLPRLHDKITIVTWDYFRIG